MLRITALCLTGLFCASLVPAQEDGKRIALVIGNDAYAISPLKNAVNDARAMQKALSLAGFRVTLVENGRKADLEEKIGQFLESLGPDDTALFFYAGHGVQIDNENFLVPTDLSAGNSLAAAKFACISMARVFDELARKRAKKNIVILDACRSNPVAQKYSLEGGLAQPQNAGRETYTVFSTSPGQVATDNPDGNNSWFTEALADLISQPRLTFELNEVFTRVKKRVSDQTEGRQTPWTLSSLTTSFFFHAPADQTAENDPTLVEKWMQDALRREQQGDWSEAIDKINQILKRKPGGGIEQTAKSKLPYLTARKNAQDLYDNHDFAGSSKLFETALTQDPFAIDAAFQGVNSHLLNSELPEAVRLLKSIRVRGNSASFAKANAMLGALAKVYPEAGEELKAQVPQPPPMQEIFASAHLGTPDWDAGNRVVQTSPVDLGRWSKEVIAAFPAQPAPTVATAEPAPATAPTPAPAAPEQQMASVNNAMFHVEINPVGNTRNLSIVKTGAAPVLNTTGVQRPSGVPVKIVTEPPGAEVTVEGDDQHCQSPCLFSLPPAKQVIHVQMQGYRTETRTLNGTPARGELQILLEQEMGSIKLDGSAGNTPVYVNGQAAAQQVPVVLELPTGKYQIRSVQNGKVLTQQDVDVTTTGASTVQVKR